MRLFAVAAPGLEGVLEAEVRALRGVSEVAGVPGGVEMTAGREGLYGANLRLRTATRVVVRLGEVEARDFARLRKRAAALPWEELVAPGTRVETAVTVRKSRLYHTGAIAERILGAASDRLGRDAAAGEHPLRVAVRGDDDRFVLSVDSSGELLHRRGWRTEAGPAPLRETLAAGVLLLAGYDGREPLLDPTCGAGTFVIEAAAIATGRAPGVGRSFAFERFPGHDAALLERLRAELVAAVHAPAAPIAGSDADAAIVEVARRNAERAGVGAAVALSVAALESLGTGGPAGLVVANPPYGHRLETGVALYRALGRFARAGGHRLALVASDEKWLRAAGRPRALLPLVNGGLRVTLALYGD